MKLTVIIPLKLDNSTFAPTSALDNFSITPATGFKAAKRWKCLFAATFVNKAPNLRAAALNINI